MSTDNQVNNERYNPALREKYWQEFWEESKVYAFDPEAGKPVFNIDTPPPTVSGALHLGHIYSYTQAEIIARFMRMNNFSVRYPLGMDNNGLPTERLVEKERGIRGKDVALKEFVEICLEVTEKYRKEYENLWKSVGLSVDWTLEYSTISAEVQKISQSVFVELFNKGLIYKKNAPALYCCECQTSFAQAEKEDKEKDSVFYDLTFKLEDGNDLTIATTRPELLPACVAVFVHPEDERFKKYIGKKITTPLGDTVEILADDKVEQEKGSGVVMCCTYGDETDIYWSKKYNLPEKIIISRDGRFLATPSFADFDGARVATARKIIVEKLKELGAITAEKPIKHMVDVHERCGTAVEYLPTSQWFVKLLDMKEKLSEAGNQINWRPAHMKKRYDEWVGGLKWDWCISRERFYGIPIPVYNCTNCDHVELVAVDSLPADPKLMEVEKICPQCGVGKMVAERSVLDTWFTSALTPEINNSSKYNGKLQGTLYPMSMRPQAHDIIRTWALYTILMGLYRHNQVPWVDLMISGHILAKQGEKISKKSGGSKLQPNELIQTHSADAIRYAMCGSALGRDAYFEEREVDKGKKLINKLYNAAKLILVNLNDFEATAEVKQLEAADQWIVGRSLAVAEAMAKSFKEYDFAHARIVFEEFFWQEYCDNYLEMVKDRLYNGSADKKKSAQYAVYHSFLNILKMASPFIPHITEEIFHATINKESNDGKILMHSAKDSGFFAGNFDEPSIHITSWPVAAESMAETIIKGGELTMHLISELRKMKAQRGVKLSGPMAEASIKCSQDQEELLKPFIIDIAATLKIKDLKFERQESNAIQDIMIS